jgi:hypothetical protein
MPPVEHYTDAAGLAAQSVEFYEVQRFVVRSDESFWVSVPDGQRADELEAFDFVESLARDFPATRYRVVRRWRARL